MSFFWYSLTGEAEAWKSAPSEQRANVISTIKPAFVTVLDAAQIPQTEWERNDYLKLKYTGPFYADWDAEDIEDSIRGFKLFLVKLQEDYKFDLQSALLFATGGRGFHLEIPAKAFIAKPPPGGVQQLPLVYREMALDLATDALDLQVYSSRRGRMWRVPNIERSNGKYKVPISVDEALNMTPELYEALTAAPRFYAGDPAASSMPWLFSQDGTVVAPAQPEVTLDLQSLFAEKREQVDTTIKKQAKVKDERQQLAKFGGQAPASLQALMNGEHLRSDIGFNTIALQLAIAGAALGLDEKTFMGLCEGFVKNHSGDGSRYNSPRRRHDALRDRFGYVSESPVYVFTMAGLRSICEPGFTPADLFGGAAASEFDWANVDDKNPYASLSEEDRAAIEMADRNDLQGMRMIATGIYARRETGPERISTMSFVDPEVLIDIESGKVLGYMAIIKTALPDGTLAHRGRHSLPASIFNSRASLDGFCQGYSSYYRGTDVGATVVRTLINNDALRNNKMQYVLTREGLEVIEEPTLVGPGDKPLLLWSSAESVLTADDLVDGETSGKMFTFRPRLQTNSTLRINAHTYPVPVADEQFAAWFKSVLSCNQPAVVAAMFGWFVSCFHRQLHHRVHGEFPLLMGYGAAGSGKSTTPHLFIRLFTSNPPGSWEHAGLGMTRFAWQALMARSSSMPAVLDEFKRQSFHEKDYMQILEELRLAYNQSMMARGGVSDGSAKADYREIHHFARSTPLMLLSETMIDETATRDRIVPIAMAKECQNREAWAAATTSQGLENMTRLGCLIIRRSLQIDIDQFKERFHEVEAEVRRKCYPSFDGRPINNYAVVLMGLDFLAESLREGIGMDVDTLIYPMRDAVLKEGMRQASVTPITANSIKVMADIAYITRTEDAGSRWSLRDGTHYLVNDEEGWIDMDMGATYRIYQDYAKNRGMDLHYASAEAFCAGLATAPSIIMDTECAGSPLRRFAATTIFRFNKFALEQKGVEPFHTTGIGK